MTRLEGGVVAGDPATSARKGEHIELALRDDLQLGKGYFEDYVLEHRALPEIALEDVDIRARFLGRELSAPLLISGMTGGTPEAARINRNLAEAAERAGVVLGVGSQRVAVEDPTARPSFQVRELAPSVPVLANLGAVQLNYGFGLDECRVAVDMIGADALVFHLNPLQEAIQPEGQTNFRNLLDRLEEVSRGLHVPVAVKEIGCGISAADARALRDRGIRIIDTAGSGGTSWARIEARRARDPELGEAFARWGIPSPLAIREVAAVEGVTVIGSGGIRSGVDAAKALALGADLVGIAQPFLGPALESADAVVRRIDRVVSELRIAMFCAGASTTVELKNARFVGHS